MLRRISHFTTLIMTFAEGLLTLNASKANRLKMLNCVKQNPKLLPQLFEFAHNSKAKREHIYAAWVWELYILEDVHQLLPYLNNSLKKLPKINSSSMRRSHSKILWHFVKATQKSNPIEKKPKKK